MGRRDLLLRLSAAERQQPVVQQFFDERQHFVFGGQRVREPAQNGRCLASPPSSRIAASLGSLPRARRPAALPCGGWILSSYIGIQLLSRSEQLGWPVEITMSIEQKKLAHGGRYPGYPPRDRPSASWTLRFCSPETRPRAGCPVRLRKSPTCPRRCRRECWPVP